jgi:Ca2+/Na+ antiporter
LNYPNQGILESAPQLLLQLYIIMSGTDETNLAAAISAAFSMISIAWGLASYVRALRKAFSRTQENHMSRIAVFVYFLWVNIL